LLSGFLASALRRHRRVDDQDVAFGVADVGDRFEIGQRVVRQPAIDRRVHGERGRDDQQRVAVGRSLDDFLGAERAVRTRPIVHHHRLAELRMKLLAEDARHRIGCARGERHHQADRAARISLRPYD
jgi:hypothetical protein